MIRKLIGLACSCLIAAGAILASGCGGDEGQPSRDSISAPRKGGGLQGAAGEKGKGGKVIEAPKGAMSGKGDL